MAPPMARPATRDLLDRLLGRARDAPASPLGAPPALRLAILVCMDARIDPLELLGLAPGDAHVVRNAGGLATDDAIRSLTLSQRLLGTRQVLVLQHTGCGLLGLDDDAFAEAVAGDAGVRPPWRAGGIGDLDESVRATVARLRASPFLLHREAVRGGIVDLERGGVREVPAGGWDVASGRRPG
jgi:carbonic anhydrase